MTPTAGVYEIRCAEIWGGATARQDEIVTPGVNAVIHSSPAGGPSGGDLYYFSVCAYDTLTRLAIADVRGHGPEVSHISQWLYESLEARMNDPDGAQVLSDLNRIVCARGFEAMTTAAVATFHRDKGVLYFAYAGHPPMLLRRAGHAWMELEAPASTGPSNLPLGAIPGARFAQEKIRVAPGDRLFVYTDGVLECPAPGREEETELFGDAGMRTALDQCAAQPLDTARRQIHDAMLRHAGGPLSHDDCTFLLMEMRQPPPFWKRRLFAGKPRAIGNRLTM